MPHPAHRFIGKRGLLGLPDIQLPSIPILGPVVTPLLNPLLNGGAPTTTTTTTRTTATARPAQSTTKSTSNDVSPPATGQSANPLPTKTVASSPASPVSTNTDGSAGAVNESPSAHTIASDSGSDPAATPTATTSIDPAAFESQATATNPALTLSGSVLLSISGTGASAQTVTVPISQLLPIPQNAAVDPDATSASSVLGDNETGISITHSATVTGIADATATTVFSGSSHGNASSGNGSDSSSSSPSGFDGATSTSHKGLSPAALGVLVTLLVLGTIAAILFAIRRVHQRRRTERRTRWMPVMADATGASGNRNSARSSFATNFDHGLRSQTPPEDTPVIPEAVTTRSPSSSFDSQWLIVNPAISRDHVDNFGQPLPSPISVRLFSPTESYKFPQPPRNRGSDMGPFTNTTPPDTVSLVDGNKTGNTRSLYSQSSLELVDTTDAPPLPAHQAFEKRLDVLVKRPFAPTLPDELFVEPGELVRIQDAFDDGWGLVQKNDGSRGLVPLACFEDRDQNLDVPAFLAAQKRKSSLVDHSILLGLTH